MTEDERYMAAVTAYDDEQRAIEEGTALRAETPAASLDEAWAEAEAALPEGWRIFGVSEPAETRALDGVRRYWASAHGPVVRGRCDMGREHDEYPRENGYGPAPADALRDLARALRAAVESVNNVDPRAYDGEADR